MKNKPEQTQTEIAFPDRFKIENAAFDDYRESQFKLCTNEQRAAIIKFLDAQKAFEDADNELSETFHMPAFEFIKKNDFEGAKNSMRGCPNSPAKVMIFHHILIAENTAKGK